MSQSNILFEDLLEVESIDKDIKVFEKVQRIEGKTEDSNCEIILDVNSEIYPMQKAVYSILLAKSLNTDGTPSPTTFNYDLGAYQTTNYANYEAISAPVYETLNVPNKKTLDTEKNKLNEDQNKFQQTKEEIQKTFISQEQISIKEESGDFLCPNCGHNLLGVIRELVEWRSRENNGTKKFVFYGIDDDFKPWWCGTMKEIYYGSYTDSGSSCGIKRHIHIKSWTKLVFKKNNSIEVCWREALTDKEWNEKLGILGCLYCDYKSNFIDFIRIKKSQAIK